MFAELRVEMTLEGELAEQVRSYISKGYFQTRPELIRAALRSLFKEINETDLTKARREKLEDL